MIRTFLFLYEVMLECCFAVGFLVNVLLMYPLVNQSAAPYFQQIEEITQTTLKNWLFTIY